MPRCSYFFLILSINLHLAAYKLVHNAHQTAPLLFLSSARINDCSRFSRLPSGLIYIRDSGSKRRYHPIYECNCRDLEDESLY